jgi:hypothetical protein
MLLPEQNTLILLLIMPDCTYVLFHDGSLLSVHVLFDLILLNILLQIRKRTRRGGITKRALST